MIHTRIGKKIFDSHTRFRSNVSQSCKSFVLFLSHLLVKLVFGIIFRLTSRIQAANIQFDLSFFLTALKIIHSLFIHNSAKKICVENWKKENNISRCFSKWFFWANRIPEKWVNTHKSLQFNMTPVLFLSLFFFFTWIGLSFFLLFSDYFITMSLSLKYMWNLIWSLSYFQPVSPYSLALSFALSFSLTCASYIR